MHRGANPNFLSFQVPAAESCRSQRQMSLLMATRRRETSVRVRKSGFMFDLLLR